MRILHSRSIAYALDMQQIYAPPSSIRRQTIPRVLFTEKHPAEPGQLTARWSPLKPHPEQFRLINSPARFKVVPVGRRSGKTERAKRNLVIQAIKESSEGEWLDYRNFAAAPTRDQAKVIQGIGDRPPFPQSR